MNTDKNTPRYLGAAFLLQAIASAVAAFLLLEPLIVPGSVIESMANIANNVTQMRASILFHMITAMGIVMLGCLLYRVLHFQSNNIALVAMGLYIMEAAILAASRIPAFSLLRASQESVIMGHPDFLQTLGSLLYESAEFGDWLHMLPFALGATMFYYLFYKSRTIPRVLAIWGLIAASLALIGTPLVLLGFDIPMIIFLPNLPFELTIGVWLLVKGIRVEEETEYNSVRVQAS